MSQYAATLDPNTATARTTPYLSRFVPRYPIRQRATSHHRSIPYAASTRNDAWSHASIGSPSRKNSVIQSPALTIIQSQ